MTNDIIVAPCGLRYTNDGLDDGYGQDDGSILLSPWVGENVERMECLRSKKAEY